MVPKKVQAMVDLMLDLNGHLKFSLKAIEDAQ